MDESNVQIKRDSYGLRKVKPLKSVYECLEEIAQEQQTQQGADKGTGTEHSWGSIVLGADARLWSRDKAAEGAHKVGLGTFVDLLVELLWAGEIEQCELMMGKYMPLPSLYLPH